MSTVALLLFLVCLVVAYLGPALIARARKHPAQTSIHLLNLFLGWTIVFWFVALVWAYKKPPTPEDPSD